MGGWLESDGGIFHGPTQVKFRANSAPPFWGKSVTVVFVSQAVREGQTLKWTVNF